MNPPPSRPRKLSEQPPAHLQASLRPGLHWQEPQESSEQAHGAPPAHPPPIGTVDGGGRPPPHDAQPACWMSWSVPVRIAWAYAGTTSGVPACGSLGGMG